MKTKSPHYFLVGFYLLTACLISVTESRGNDASGGSYATDRRKFWLHGGADGGYSRVNTDQPDEVDKDGYHLQLKLQPSI